MSASVLELRVMNLEFCFNFYTSDSLKFDFSLLTDVASQILFWLA